MASEIAGNAIREALEPFARAATGVGAIYRDEDRISHTPHVSMILTVGDLRRARTAYDAIGSGVKSLEWEKLSEDTYVFDNYAVRKSSGRVGWEWRSPLGFNFYNYASADEAKAAAQADFERRVLSCLSPVAVEEADARALSWVENASALLKLNEKGAVSHPVPGLAVSLLRSAIDLLSTHTAAGAGPVGEAVAWRYWCDTSQKWFLVPFRQNAPSDARAEPLYARPVEEPGEVERLTRERDEAVRRGEDQWAGWVREGVARKAAEAALAETRERLEKVDRIRSLGWAVAVHNDYRLNGEAHTFWLFTKDGRAVKGEGRTDDEALIRVLAEIDALTGDAQEAGRSPSPADQIVGQIEKRFPNWRSYRDLLDCIDCTLHDLRRASR